MLVHVIYCLKHALSNVMKRCHFTFLLLLDVHFHLNGFETSTFGLDFIKHLDELLKK